MPALNVASTPVEVAARYILEKFSRKKIYTSLPYFKENYLLLQDKMGFSLDINRRQMPVIEPKDMVAFKNKIKSGHIDIFKPFAKTHLWPEEFKGRGGQGWLTLGLKDGQISDDVLKAELISVPAIDLKPIQKQIWLSEIVRGMLSFGVPTASSKILDAPIIISSEYYIIDGHHRWAQVMVSNPDLEMQCLYVPLNILTLMNMTKTYGRAIGNEPNW